MLYPIFKKTSFFRNRALRIAVFLLISAVCLLPSALAQTGGLKGKVRTNGGQVIPNARVTVRRDGKDLTSSKADANGLFRIEGLESGNYNLVVDADGYTSGILYNVEVKKKKVRDLGERLILSIDQGTLVIVKGSVFFREGSSVTGAKVEIEKVDSDGSTKKLATALTNISGEFTFRQPEGRGKYRITAKFNGVSGSKMVEVDNAAIYRLAISLDLSRIDK